MSIEDHSQLEELLAGAALEALSSSDRVEVLTHVSTCAHCARLLEQYGEVAAALAGFLPSLPMEPALSVQLRERLLGRAANAGEQASERVVRPAV